MIAIKSRWKSLTNTERWAARRASFVAKVRATKAVWSAPKSVEHGPSAASTAKTTTAATKRSTQRATKKTTQGGTKKTTKGPTKKTSGAAKKTTNGPQL
jgi:hypothetical protein